MTKDFTKNYQITDEQHVVLRDLDRIMVRWKGCIDKLLNEENHRSVFEDEVPNDGYPRNQQECCKRSVIRHEEGKTGKYGIPVEVWRCLGEEGIDML